MAKGACVREEERAQTFRSITEKSIHFASQTERLRADLAELLKLLREVDRWIDDRLP
jgi:hypothetical protein